MYEMSPIDELFASMDDEGEELTTDEYGPDSPRDWNPNATELRSPEAPHETGGVLRMHRNGMKGSEIMKTLRLKGTALMVQMSDDLDAESDAKEVGVDIHDAVIRRAA